MTMSSRLVRARDALLGLGSGSSTCPAKSHGPEAKKPGVRDGAWVFGGKERHCELLLK